MSDKNLRKNLIRVASELPQGSEERKTLLSILQEDAASTKQAGVARSRQVPVKIALSGQRIVPGSDDDPAHFEGWLTAPAAKASVKVQFSYRPGRNGALMEFVEVHKMERFVEALVNSVMEADPTYLDKKKW